MLVKNIELEYQDNPEISREEIQKLLNWLKQQPHLPEMNENCAILFFHACMYSMEMTKQTIDIYFTLRSQYSEFFDDWNLQNNDIQKAMNTIGVFPLNQTTSEGYRVLVSKLCDLDPSNFNFANSVKLYCMLFELLLYKIGTAPGYILLFDLEGCTLGHIVRLGPLTMKKLLIYLQDAAPIRLKGFHFINLVPHADKIVALIRPFLKAELSEALHLHPKLETLNPFIPLKILPKDYGGMDETSDILKKNLYDYGLENQEYFTREETKRVNEKLRPNKPKYLNTICATEGNFKKLDID